MGTRVKLSDLDKSFVALDHQHNRMVLDLSMCRECGDLPELVVFVWWFSKYWKFESSLVCLCRSCYDDFWRDGDDVVVK